MKIIRPQFPMTIQLETQEELDIILDLLGASPYTALNTYSYWKDNKLKLKSEMYHQLRKELVQ